MIEQKSSLWERLKICWEVLTKKNYAFFGISENPIIWSTEGNYKELDKNAVSCYSCISYDYIFNTINGVTNLHDFVWNTIENFAKKAQKGEY